VRNEARWLVVGLSVLFASGCKKDTPKPVPVASTKTSPSASASGEFAIPDVKSEEKDEAPDAPRVDGGAFATGALSDVGPAGPASASPFGVVMITKQDDVVLAAPGKEKGSFKSITLVASTFSEIQPAPSIAGDFAYFITHGKLVRRRIKPIGPVEALTDGARDNTRVSALPATDSRPAAVTYIARAQTSTGSPTAMLWVEGHDSVRLSPDGTGASSVSMTESGDGAAIAILDGRTGMTPVHARRVTFPEKKPSLGENTVVWVAGPAQPTTELALLSTANDAWIFSALDRETTRFGLAEVHIGTTPKMGSPVEWRMYPNGIDPAPVATVHGCGKDLVVYTRPTEAKPGSPHELHLAAVGASGLEAPDVLTKAPAITSVSVSASEDSLWVVYVASGRTWALTAACPGAKKK
jgi:hypothetical protein